MSETNQLKCQEQDAVIWVGLQAFRDLSDWMMETNDHRLQGNRPEAMSQEDGVMNTFTNERWVTVRFPCLRARIQRWERIENHYGKPSDRKINPES